MPYNNMFSVQHHDDQNENKPIDCCFVKAALLQTDEAHGTRAGIGILTPP
jgi:hypothetical protein